MGLVFYRRYDGPTVPAALLDELPQQTTLQRAIVAHRHAGGPVSARVSVGPVLASRRHP